MPEASFYFVYLKAGLDLLENYLLSDEVYRQLNIRASGNDPPYPPLTLGTLLLYKLFARGKSHSSREIGETNHYSQELEIVRSKWKVAWEKKAKAEFHARLNLWRDFLEEYRQSPHDHHDRFAYEVTRRVMLHLLRDEAYEIPNEELLLLASLDVLLEAKFVPGAFIWDDDFTSEFEQPVYWYLYGNLQQD